MKACYNTYHITFQSSTHLCCTLPYLMHHFMGRSSWSQAAIPARLAELGPQNSIVALTLHLLHMLFTFSTTNISAACSTWQRTLPKDNLCLPSTWLIQRGPMAERILTSKRQPLLAIHMANPERLHGRTDPRPPYHPPL